MSKDYLVENLNLKQELDHANKTIERLNQAGVNYRESIDQWKEHYTRLEEIHTQIVQSKKRHIQRIQKKARSNPWPWALSGLTLIIGLTIGLLL